MTNRSILIKVTGELFSNDQESSVLSSFIEQIQHIATSATLGIVIGGGNFFRGSHDGKRFGMCESAAHEVGMLATVMNGRILQNLLKENGIQTKLMSAIPCPTIAEPLSSYAISDAIQKKMCMIFAGGTGNPFVTTDTNAIIRALQINATEVWKVTTVDGLYDSDPQKNKAAQLIAKTTFDDVISRKLNVMDQAAMIIARDRNMPIRIMNLYASHSLIHAYTDPTFGSKVC